MRVGIVGLGIMGSAYGKNLLAAGHEVVGADPAPAGREALMALGGVAHDGTGDWVRDCEVIVISLASPKVLAAVGAQLGGLLRPGQVVVETGTFALPDKFALRDAVAPSGAWVLDCPVSGTGAQAARADLVLMASGPEAGIEAARPVLQILGHTVLNAGEYGMGSRLKYVANHAVVVHNTAAAETLNYALRLGLDAELVYRMLSGGAGQSRMSDLRMPLMIHDGYRPATAAMSMFRKDIEIIGADIAAQGVQAPLFAAATAQYQRAFAIAPPDYDSAAVYEAYRTPKAEG